jgi:hypothetical protein
MRSRTTTSCHTSALRRTTSGNTLPAWPARAGELSDLSKPDVVGMTAVQVPMGEYLVLVLQGADEFRAAQPEIFGALFGSTAHVNRVKVTIEGATRLLLLPV